MRSLRLDCMTSNLILSPSEKKSRMKAQINIKDTLPGGQDGPLCPLLQATWKTERWEVLSLGSLISVIQRALFFSLKPIVQTEESWASGIFHGSKFMVEEQHILIKLVLLGGKIPHPPGVFKINLFLFFSFTIVSLVPKGKCIHYFTEVCEFNISRADNCKALAINIWKDWQIATVLNYLPKCSLDKVATFSALLVSLLEDWNFLVLSP